MKSVPTFNQQDPIPMMINSRKSFQPLPISSKYKDPSIDYRNSFKNNRIAPQQSDYNTYYQPTSSIRVPSSVQSSKALIQPSHIYSVKQPVTDRIDPYNSNQSYYSQNKYIDSHYTDDVHEKNRESNSYCWKRTCFGLTRLTAGILFGTMILLSVISIGGLVVSIILYVQDSNTNSQWKILGIVVSCIMLLTVIVTLFIFIYCYKNGHIGNIDKNNNLANGEHNQENDLGKTNYFNRSYNMSSLPYGTIQNASPFSTNEDVIQVEDKQTNTETTIAPLRPRDWQRGVWPTKNAYGGLSYRPFEKPTMNHRFVQTTPYDFNQIASEGKTNLMNTASTKLIQLPGNSHHQYQDQQQVRSIELKRPYEIVETIVPRPRGRPTEEYLTYIQSPMDSQERIDNGRAIQILHAVSIKRIKALEEPNLKDKFSTDHFYQ